MQLWWELLAVEKHPSSHAGRSGLSYRREVFVVEGHFSLNETQLTIFRRRNIGFVFQNYNLVPVLNVYENIVLPIELDGEEPDKAYVDEIIRTLGMEEKRYSLPNQLSGGQQQRVAIARALASNPVFCWPMNRPETWTANQAAP